MMSVLPAVARSATDLIALGVLALLYLFGLGTALYQAYARPRGRLYWLACLALIVAGSGLMAFAPPASPDSGEMPPGFGLGVLVVFAGVAAVSAGCAWRAISRLRRPRR
jgi:drug/metabolite transporter (DMT)-like permease